MIRRARRRARPWLAWCAAAPLLGACQSSGAELSGLALEPPLDYAVLVTGGAFLAATPGDGIFGRGHDGEPLEIDELAQVLRDGAVFRRLAVDPDAAHRRAVVDQLRAGADAGLAVFLQRARDDGFDLLLVVEQLQNGSIDRQGINSRWPLTLATWLLLGVGMFIPDHTFDSNTRLRSSVRDLQTGRVVYDSLVDAGPVDLSLVERSDFFGILISILVPPFWVHDDDENVLAGVREVAGRRLLLQLARDLKSELVRQRLRESGEAAFAIEDGRVLVVEARHGLSAVRLRPAAGPLPDEVVLAFERRLLASLQRSGGRLVYREALPAELPAGPVQVLIGTITGEVASATLVAAGPP